MSESNLPQMDVYGRVKSADYQKLEKKISRLIAAIKKLSVYGDEKNWDWNLFTPRIPRWDDSDGNEYGPWLPAQHAIESVKDILDEE